MRSIVFILLILAGSFKTHGQATSVGGNFTVDYTSGCAPLAVKFSTSACAAINSCNLIKDPGTPFQKTKVVQNNINVDSFVFYTPGIHRIKLLTGSQISDSITINVHPSTPPTFNVYSCKNYQAVIEVTDTNYDTYRVDYPSSTIFMPNGSAEKTINLPSNNNVQYNVSVIGNYTATYADNTSCPTNTKSIVSQQTLSAPIINLLTVMNSSQMDINFPLAANQINNEYEVNINTNGAGAFVAVSSTYNQSSKSITNISTDVNYYCVKLKPFDRCTHLSTSVNESNTICSIRFRSQDVVVGDKVNDLTWATSSPDNYFTIKRDPDASIAWANGLRNYSHMPVTCATQYNYQIISNYLNGAQSLSASRQVIGNSTTPPNAINNITASLNADGTVASFAWDAQSEVKKYSLFRNNTLLTETTDITYTDNDYHRGACYELSFVDLCNNTSQTPNLAVCPIYVSSVIKSDNSVQLKWNKYTGWKNGVVTYTIEKYTTDGQFIMSADVAGNILEYTDSNQDENQSYVYIIKANSNDIGLGQAISNAIIVTKDPRIFNPSALAPNSDNVDNRSFKVQGQFIEEFEMQIFNRWGEMVFSTTDMDKGWDGSHAGLPAPEGVYAFIARLTDKEGNKYIRKGTVMLLRKK
jgi:gliding motility-associated-like protein